MDHTSYWISNAVLVRGGTEELAQSLAKNAKVAQIRETSVYEAPEPIDLKKTGDMGHDAVEWGISAINADDVWASGITGQGITVSSIDSGTDVNHPALKSKYRGLLPGGTFDNNYNFFDSAGACNDAGDPCDTDGHGTHTMGTMLGSDGANQIGVAPDANWIEANGCSTCADADLMESGQWMLAPTRTDGTGADPSKRPHVINNSWGSRNPSNDPFMEDITLAWEAAGIFGQWSNGNSGPACNTSGSPGSRIANYSSGAFDISGNIASFSARGAGQDGVVKPNISAPGVNVRSSLPGGSYGTANGTSMASPHVAGAVALLWSAAPSLVGDIAGTRALLNSTAVDTSDLTCGGTAENNNVWGQGKLDVQALIAAAPVGNAGHIAGTVTAGGNPVSGATVQVTGPTTRTLTTGADGAFNVAVTAGDYTVKVTAFGYLASTQSTSVAAGATATVSVALEAAARHTVSGTVTMGEGGPPVNGATVAIASQIASVTTGSDGRYSIADVPEGTYTLSVSIGGCAAPFSREVVVDGDETVNAALAARADGYGYTCSVTTGTPAQGTTQTTLTGDESSLAIDLPWSFPLYGNTYPKAYVSTNGHINFLAGATLYSNGTLPSAAAPNAAIYPYWDDLNIDASAGVWTGTTTIGGVEAFVIEYRNVRLYADANARTNFSVALLRNGKIVMGYGAMTEGKPALTGTSATIGIENATGTVAWLYSFNNAGVVSPNMSLTFSPPPSGTLSGTITDANDHLPVAGAKVTITPATGDPVSVTTAEDGTYSKVLFLGTYAVKAEAENYVTESTSITFDSDGDTAEFSPALKTGIATITGAESYDWGVLAAGDTRRETFTVKNTGTAPLEFSVAESGRKTTSSASRPAVLSGDAVKTATKGHTSAKSAKGLFSTAQRAAQKSLVGPTATGDVLKSWDTGLSVAWGVGVNSNTHVWISDPEAITNTAFTTDGAAQAEFPGNWGGSWNGDMALNTRTGEMCQVNVGGDNTIVCFDSSTGVESSRIDGPEWTSTSQRGLAYNEGEDVFYIGGWNEGILYTVAGPTHDTPGATLAQCETAEPGIAGLAFNSESGTVWMVPSAETTVFYQLSPADCSTLRTVAFPSTEDFPGAGLEADAEGNLWAADQVSGKAYLVDVGDPISTDVPWISVDPTTATIAVGETKTFTVDVDASLAEPGVWSGALRISTGAGRVKATTVPFHVVISSYSVGVDAGGAASQGKDLFLWKGDKPWAAGSWGYVGSGTRVVTTSKAIAKTDDPKLFQTQRVGAMSYRFDDAPAGTYAVDFGFAELANTKAGKHQFDVKVNGAYVLVGKDIVKDAGTFTADLDQITVEHAGGTLTIEFVPRKAMGQPVINTLKVQERSDL
ncbi:peptidase S8 [Knoellia subterranea KCTC 19937]|uniref:Peptidase S8 n=1 Tax=Knoellia subterranea KCTC 19937 TaxID=1385521 RepID=A0A0A0JNB0_9MICO|nr:peptidase S8 [Knoellia subterranea KCTC 19937]